MINRTDLMGISGTVKSSVGAAADDSDLGFEKLLTEKTAEGEEKVFTEEVMEHILKSIASMHEGSKSIWEIVLQLEEHVDPKLLAENLNMEFDETAGLNSIAGLLARYWKKKELLEEKQAEDYAVFSRARGLSAFDDNAVLELAALTLKKKAQRLVTEV